jgi:hypothetical protein
VATRIRANLSAEDEAQLQIEFGRSTSPPMFAVGLASYKIKPS